VFIKRKTGSEGKKLNHYGNNPSYDRVSSKEGGRKVLKFALPDEEGIKSPKAELMFGKLKKVESNKRFFDTKANK